MRLAGKCALITGGAHGIGLATAAKFLREGAHVFVVDRAADRLEEAREALAVHGASRVATLVADVAREEDRVAMVGKALERFGRLDVLVNNAGIARAQPFLEHSEENWDETLAINLKAVYRLSQLVARHMVAARSGVILNMSSTNGLMGERGLAAYNASKAGVLLLTKTMAIELGPYGVRAVAVCPGFIATGLAEQAGLDEELQRSYLAKIPLQRFGTPEDVANLMAFLASDEASFITGTGVVIDGGQLAEE